jgi:hypothetical protein
VPKIDLLLKIPPDKIPPDKTALDKTALAQRKTVAKVL